MSFYFSGVINKTYICTPETPNDNAQTIFPKIESERIKLTYYNVEESSFEDESSHDDRDYSELIYISLLKDKHGDSKNKTFFGRSVNTLVAEIYLSPDTFDYFKLIDVSKDDVSIELSIDSSSLEDLGKTKIVDLDKGERHYTNIFSISVRSEGNSSKPLAIKTNNDEDNASDDGGYYSDYLSYKYRDKTEENRLELLQQIYEVNKMLSRINSQINGYAFLILLGFLAYRTKDWF